MQHEISYILVGEKTNNSPICKMEEAVFAFLGVTICIHRSFGKMIKNLIAINDRHPHTTS